MGAVAWDWLVISQSRALREKWVSEGAPILGSDETLREPTSHWDERSSLAHSAILHAARTLPPLPCQLWRLKEVESWDTERESWRAEGNPCRSPCKHLSIEDSGALKAAVTHVGACGSTCIHY